ncbi:MAG: NAD(P)-binding protein [Inquilinus sp.]|nr:NAD(P)-binding protein [Inquilinus sp.]
MSALPVAIVGAGIAGLACGAALREAGLAVEVFEKSRGLGGRIATRRVDGLAFDHGAQYATVRGEAFPAAMQELVAAGAAAEWRPAIRDHRLDGSGDERSRHRDRWFVGTPGMSAMVRPLADGQTVHRGRRVTGLTRRRDGWALTLDDESVTAGPYAAIAVTAPAPQALALLEPFGAPFDRAVDAHMAPCWTVLAAFDALPVIADVIRPSRGPITWAARTSALPDRSPRPECWVIHGDPVWSRDHLEEEREAIADALLAALAEASGAVAAPVYRAAHRWRHARALEPVGEPCLLSGDGTLGAAGDWCLGARVEAAFDSGRALGRALAARLTP